MTPRESIVLMLLATLAITEATTKSEVTRNTGSDELICTSVETVPLCADLGYVNTTFPNLRGHTSPDEANEELFHFLALISTGCSNAIVHLLCSIYAPMCIQKYNFKYPPCKNLCESVRDGCADTLLHNFGYSWPPGPHLDCQNYDTVQDNKLCFGPSDPSILRMPPIINNRDPPQNLIAVLLSPSTVKFTWEPPEGSTDEVFILTCDPQPYQFPFSTSGTTLKSGHFSPDTEYTCSIFTAHTDDVNNSSTTVQFTTGKMGPPQNFRANHLSPQSVRLSWSHPDSELPKRQQDNYLYVLACQSQNNNFQMSAQGGRVDLQNLEENTEYTCQLSVAPSLTENETATLTFTTLETLRITFTNNTPNVFNHTVGLEFHINRPATKVTCRILGHDRKRDCSNHRALFHNVPTGNRRLQIIAENSREDKLNYRIRVYVSGADTSSCAVNLINNRITYVQDSVMLYFKGTNFADKFKCSLNKQTSFECYSPLLLRRLKRTRHQIKITPTSDWCQHTTPLLLSFTVG